MSLLTPRNLSCVCIAFFVSACEAPLELSDVNSALAKATYRSDLFQAVAFQQGTAIAVGGMGAIVRSDDAGANWQRATLPGKPFLVDATVCPDGHFYTIEKTDGIWSLQTDGSWSRKTLPEMTEPQAVTCDSSNVLWVTGGFSSIFHSNDAGDSWESWSLDEDLYLTTIQFTDDRHGVVTGEFGTVLVSADSGSSWERAENLPGDFYPQSAYFSDRTSGWVVGLNGTIWATEDNAQSWRQITTGFNIPLYGVTGTGDTLVAVGENTTILFHRPGDSSWNLLESAMQTRTYLRAVTAVDDHQFVTAGGGGALFTINVPEQVATEVTGDNS